MLKDIKLDDLREMVNNSLIKPVNDIKVHGYFTKFDPVKLSYETTISLVNLWIKLMETGVWKPGGTIDNPELYISEGLQLTDIGIMINHRVPSANEFVSLINILAISNLEYRICTEQVLLAKLCQHVDYVLANCPEGFKDIEPCWYDLSDYLEGAEKIPHKIAENRDLLDHIKKYLIEKYKFVEAHDFRSDWGYTHNDILIEFIKNSYFYVRPDSRFNFRFTVQFEDHPLYKYALRHMNWYQAQDYLENNPKAKYIVPYLSALNKMWYRLFNDGDTMATITEPSIMVGINVLTELNDLPFNDSVIINCFAHRALYKLIEIDSHHGSDEELEEHLNSYYPICEPKVSGMSKEDYLDIINGRKSDQWLTDFDVYEAKLDVRSWTHCDSWLDTVMQLTIAIGDAFKVYPDILKSTGIRNFYGRYINENKRY